MEASVSLSFLTHPHGGSCVSLSLPSIPGVHVGLVPLGGPVERDALVVGRWRWSEQGHSGLLEGVGDDDGAPVGLGVEALLEGLDGVGCEAGSDEGVWVPRGEARGEPDAARVGPLGALVEQDLWEDLVGTEGREAAGWEACGSHVGEDAGRGLELPRDERKAGVGPV